MDDVPAADAAVQLGDVRVTRDRAVLLDQTTEVVRVQIVDVQSLAICRGSTVAHPVAATILAGVLLFIAWRAINGIVRWWFVEGGLIWDVEILMVLSIAPGMWLLRDVLRRVPYLLIITKHGSRKLPFGTGDSEALHNFALRAGSLLDLPVEVRLGPTRGIVQQIARDG